METISFPGLGLDFSINPVAFTIPFWGKGIYWYGIIIAIGFLAGMFFLLRRVTLFGLDSDRVLDVILISTLAGIVGARAYYVIFQWDEYRGNLIDIFKIQLGGLAIYGGIIGAFAAGYFACKWRRVKILPMFDLTVGSLLLGQAIGRWGNFTNSEAFGSNTNLPWGMTGSKIVRYLSSDPVQEKLAAINSSVNPLEPVHPTFLYESLWCFLGFLLIMGLTKRRRYDGQLTLVYFLWYGIGRFIIEGFRTDSLLLNTPIMPLRVSQVVALVCVIASGIMLIRVRGKIRWEGPEYLTLYVDTEESHQILAGGYYEQFKKKKNGDAAQNPSEQDGDSTGETGGEEESQETDKPVDNADSQGASLSDEEAGDSGKDGE